MSKEEKNKLIKIFFSIKILTSIPRFFTHYRKIYHYRRFYCGWFSIKNKLNTVTKNNQKNGKCSYVIQKRYSFHKYPNQEFQSKTL